jgi:hypothetical protein
VRGAGALAADERDQRWAAGRAAGDADTQRGEVEHGEATDEEADPPESPVSASAGVDEHRCAMRRLAG